MPWRGNWDIEGGGPTMGHGIHQFDLLLRHPGRVDGGLRGAGRQARPTATEDLSCAIVTFANGAVATVVNSVLSPREQSYLRFDFARATVELTTSTATARTSGGSPPVPGHEEAVRRLARGERGVPERAPAQFARGARRARGRQRPPVTLADARRTIELVAAIYARRSPAPGRAPASSAPDSPFYQRMGGGTGAPWSGVGPTDATPRARRDGRAASELFRYVYRPADASCESPRPYLHPMRTLDRRPGRRSTAARPRVAQGPGAGAAQRRGPRTSGAARPTCGTGATCSWPTTARSGTPVRTVDVADGASGSTEELDLGGPGRRAVVRREPHAARRHRCCAEGVGVAVRRPRMHEHQRRGRSRSAARPPRAGRRRVRRAVLARPRTFSGGTVPYPTATGRDELMGERAPWMAFTGRHDGTAGTRRWCSWTRHEPGTRPSGSSAASRTPWCARPRLRAEVRRVGPGETLTLRYAVVIADGWPGPGGGWRHRLRSSQERVSLPG